MFLLLWILQLSHLASAETIQIGQYSGKPGYFANVGTNYQLTLDAIVMNEEVAKKLGKLKFHKLGEIKVCEVVGLQQSLGYTLFKVKSCH